MNKLLVMILGVVILSSMNVQAYEAWSLNDVRLGDHEDQIANSQRFDEPELGRDLWIINSVKAYKVQGQGRNSHWSMVVNTGRNTSQVQSIEYKSQHPGKSVHDIANELIQQYGAPASRKNRINKLKMCWGPCSCEGWFGCHIDSGKKFTDSWVEVEIREGEGRTLVSIVSRNELLRRLNRMSYTDPATYNILMSMQDKECPPQRNLQDALYTQF